MALPFLLRRVELRNYRSIEHCDVELGPLMFLVGPNGSGKSNFLDALRFVSDCLNTSVDEALRVRGGFRAVCRSPDEPDASFSIKLTLKLEKEGKAEFLIKVAANSESSFEIARETCEFPDSSDDLRPWKYERLGHTSVELSLPELKMKLRPFPPIRGRLYLGIAASDSFYAVHQSLANMAFYNPLTAPMRDHQNLDSGDRLNRDASNSASVLRALRRTHPDWADRIFQYLAAAIPRLRRVVDGPVGEKVTLQFTEAASDGSERIFYASSMSDGTLRMLAILLALFQRSEPVQRVSLVGIEEPEMGVHPAAAAVLFESLHEASVSRQVLVTSHSSDLLDRDDVEIDSILAVSAEDGATLIGPLDEGKKNVLRKKLGTAGELLRRDMLIPERAPLPAHS